MKFAVTQTSSTGTIASSGCPGWITWPGSTLFLLTRPAVGALMVV